MTAGLERAEPPDARVRSWGLDDVVKRLLEASVHLPGERARALGGHRLPSREALVAITSSLRAALFPAYFGATELTPDGLAYFVGRTLDEALLALNAQVRCGLQLTCEGDGSDLSECERRAFEITREFGSQLPRIRELLGRDVRAAYEGDPAAKSIDEAVFCYPGLTAITYYRLAHALHALGVPMIPRIVAEIAHSATGIDIHPGAKIGGSFFIDHGTGVVIGETCLIGERVRIYQGVTLGAKSFPVDERGYLAKGIPRHPIVEDDVVIYAGATILGRITIGRGSSIGGNVWLTRSVAPYSQITQAQAQTQTFEGGSGI